MADQETIESASKDIKADWIADGTKAAEPVTTETPVVEPVLETSQPRGPDGKFLPKGSEPVPVEPSAATLAAPVAPATAAPVPVSAQAVQDMIDATRGEGTFQIPKGVKIPLKRGDQVEYATIEELQKRGMLEVDYRHKTAEAARVKREADARGADIAAREARVTARDQWLKEQEDEMRAAMKDPDKWAAYQDMQRMYQDNPRFRQVMDDALAKRETDAENEVYQEREYQSQVTEGVTLAAGWVEQFAAEFPRVNPERVRGLYAQALTSGTAQLDPAHVRGIYEQESRYLTESAGPLEKQLATLAAEVEALKGATKAEAHNAATAHALTRAKTPPVATTGHPPAPAAAAPGKPFGMRELAQRNQEWANKRD